MTVATRASTVAGYGGPALDDLLLQGARLWIAQHRPYYAAALFRCPIVVTDRVATFAVDASWRIYLDPSFANDLGVERFAAALIHELNHLLRDHEHRAAVVTAHEPDDRARWNLAADAEINDDLRDDGLDVDLTGWVFPHRFGLPDGLTAEDYLARLPEGAPEPRPSCGSGAGAGTVDGELPPAGATDGSAVDVVEAQILRRLTAEQVIDHHDQGRGTAPDGLIEWARELLTPTVDWRGVLGSSVRSALAVRAGTADYSYRRFARRSATSPQVRLPGMVEPSPTVAVVVDTSASMDDAHLAQVLGEVQGICRSASVADDAVTVLTVDTEVASVVRVRDARQVRTMGRGGTDMRVGIAAALEVRPRPDVVVVLTDGETPWPELRPRGTQVVIGIVTERGSRRRSTTSFDTPDWARTVLIRM